MTHPLRYAVLLFGAIVLGWIAASPAYAQGHNYLEVLNPQQPWFRSPGTIEAARVDVQPRGIYMEVGLTMTFSARNGGFSGADSLEVAFYFSLPEDAVMTDSWLWIGEDIIRADLFDVWTASTVYENIVRRRQDPSILFKRGGGSYELRVYPMAAHETRTVRLTYLVPTQWSARAVTAPLPADLLRASWHPIEDLRVEIPLEAPWHTPRFVERPDLPFTFSGDAAVRDVPWDAVQGALTLAFDSPLRDGVYVSRTPGAENWYQLAVLPAEALALAAPRKVAVLLDFDAPKTTVTPDELLGTLRAHLYASLGPGDAFNVIVSGLAVRRASETWLPADSASIEAAFARLGADPLGGYSNLPTLLADGLAFVDDQGDGGSVLLLASSDQVGDADVANRLLADLQATVSALPTIHVVDFTNENFVWYPVGGRYFPGNSYFYINLTRLTGGSYLDVREDGPFAQVMTDGFGALGGLIGAFDLYTTLASGFCYARFTGSLARAAVYRDQAVVQVGKCFGEAPFVIEASGVLDGTPFSQRLTIDEVGTADTTLASVWTGRQIEVLERSPQTNDVINQIIDYSLDRRVLSLYTAFLALEPGLGGQVCNTCRGRDDGGTDGGGAPTNTADESPDPEEAVLTAYPNPFTTSATIEVTLPVPVALADVRVQVYNAMGQAIRTLRVDEAGPVRTFAVTWDGTNDAAQLVASGTYFVVVTTPAGRYTVTLVLVR